MHPAITTMVASSMVAVAWAGLAAAHPGPAGPLLDVGSLHSLVYLRPVQVAPLPCTLCIDGSLVALGATGLDPEGDPADGFRPGEHVFQGEVGYRDADGNHVGSCGVGPLGPIVLEPLDGDLDNQVLVWRNHARGLEVDPLDLDADGDATLLPDLQVWGPGPVAPLRIRTHCRGETLFQGDDALEWPVGNLETILVSIAGQVAVPGGALVPMQDVDTYPAWPAG